MTIYLDVIWALNFLFDTLLLYLTAILLKRRIKVPRLILGGFTGSIIILLTITPLHTYSNHPMSKLFFSFLMVLAVFGYKRLSYFLSGLMTLYLVTFLTGGAIIGVHYFIQFDFKLATDVALKSIHGFGDPISWLFVFIGFPLAWHFSKSTLEKMEVTKIQYEQIVDVIIKIDEYELNFKGLIDSGNQLYDPISKMPVMFVSINKIEKLPEALIQLGGNSEDIILGKRTLELNWEKRMRIIPYKVVGQEHQLVIGIKPDEIFIRSKDKAWAVDKGLVCFTSQQLSSDDAFQCIVHPKMLTGTYQTTIKVG
ncbi:sigma-E processing peptidase SpoIIGA [Robertmurraya andreesenii]|uniref:Sporulation sigma-E factor-processing peptidase n=1 Tax=Anoxybacillus andreesenii TaxID=1325932 RepID=A0ABT9V4Q1_9BACL|nr:sigma-E processing peptidase SpoIIGA [Robertmurraya andreesenii]MDQ0155928.1 stage II sporulation protein GA (sporulation sigma-E factor processing peptidase) [Robertmurraya andreesenii]